MITVLIVTAFMAGGVSAGGIIAVNAAYLDQESEIPASIVDYIDENGGLEGSSGNEGYDSHFHGIINLCGAIGDYNWIVEGDIPIVKHSMAMKIR